MATAIEKGRWMRGKRNVAGANVVGAKNCSLVSNLASDGVPFVVLLTDHI